MTSFPDGFLWGASTAGHQIEGNNTQSDLWALENVPNSPFAEPSGDACDSYHRYAEDIALLAQAGLNAYRFGVEWARIEPEPGHHSRAELDHYLRMVHACLDAGVTPVVTLSHFTVPGWFARSGAWRNPEAPELFARYCETVVTHFGSAVTWYCTFNEPNLGAMLTANGTIPMSAVEARESVAGPRPEVAPAFAARLGGELGTVAMGFPMITAKEIAAVTTAHRKAAAAIKAARPSSKVGWTLAIPDPQSVPGGEQAAEHYRENALRAFLRVSRDDDFIGVQTYTREVFGPDGLVPVPDDTPKSQTGWEIYPESLGHSVRLAAEVAGVPVLVTENGLASADDERRIEYTRAALRGLRDCVDDGIDVRGYLHWTLLDNFEWYSGFAMTFGLIAVDRTTFARSPKPSLSWLGGVADDNGKSL